MNIQDIFMAELGNSKEIAKDDIIRLGEEYGITSNSREAKVKVIKKIVDAGYYERLFSTFQEFVYIPGWIIGDYLKLNSLQIDDLNRIGVITEQPKAREFYSRTARTNYEANTYPLSVLDYDKDFLINAYNQAFKKDWFKIRLETETEEDVNNVVDELKKVVEVSEAINIYERRNEGFNTYLQIHLLNNSEFEGNKYLSEIQKLKNEIKKIRIEEDQQRKDLEERYYKIFGVNNFFELREIKEEYDSMKNDR